MRDILNEMKNMVLEEREIATCKKERRVWLLASVVSGIVFMGLMIYGSIYNIRPRYGLYIVVLTYGIMFFSFIMYLLTQYISTKEILSILSGKIRGII